VSDDVKILAFIAIGLMVVFISIAVRLVIVSVQKHKTDGTRTHSGLMKYDEYAPGEAVVLAWSEPENDFRWHRKMQDEVRTYMPVLARALDRMVTNDS
jgi:hypothetical protein